MLDQLEIALREAQRIINIQKSYPPHGTLSNIERSAVHLELGKPQLAQPLTSALAALDPLIHRKVLAIFEQYTLASADEIQSEWGSTLDRMSSIQQFGGMTDATTESLVSQLFLREHARRIDNINNTLLQFILHKNDHSGPGIPSSSFNSRIVTVLESAYQRKATLNNAETVAISQMSGITPLQVRTWFQNRRNRQRKGIKPSKYHTDDNAEYTPNNPPPPPSSTSSNRTISALPSRRSNKSSTATPIVSNAQKEKTTTIAGTSGARRVKAIPRRAFPPSYPKYASPSTTPIARSQFLGVGDKAVSPAPSMARSLSAQSIDSDVSSVDPSGGFNSLLISPNETPTQVTLPQFYTPGYNGAGMEGSEMGNQGQGVAVDSWSFNLNLPSAATFGLPDLTGLEYDLMAFDLPSFGSGDGGNDGLGQGMGMGGMESLTLAATPSFTDSSSGSPTRRASLSTITQTQTQGGGGDPGEDWAWAGSIAEQMAALFEGEGKNWMAEIGSGEPDEGLWPSSSASSSEKKEDISAIDTHSTRSTSETRSITPPPISQVPYTQTFGDSIGFNTLSIPIPYHHQSHPQLYSTYISEPQEYDPHSRITSYGSTSSGGSTRIITPPSSEYTPYFYDHYPHSAQHIYAAAGQMESGSGQGGDIEMGSGCIKEGSRTHHRTPSLEGYNVSSSWTSTTPTSKPHPEAPTMSFTYPTPPRPTYYTSGPPNENIPSTTNTQIGQSGYALHPQNQNLFPYPSHSASGCHSPLSAPGLIRSQSHTQGTDAGGGVGQEDGRWIGGVLAFDSGYTNE